MRIWFRNVLQAVKTVAQGMYITLWYFLQTYRRKTFTERFEYPELPVPVKPRYRGFHRFDLTTCIGCDKCARACPVDCIYIEKIKNPVGKGFRVNGFKIDYTKCMFCALCVDPCPVDCIFMGSTYDQSCFSRDGCIVDFAKLPVEVAWGQATLNPTAVAASKLASRAGLDQAARPAAGRQEVAELHAGDRGRRRNGFRRASPESAIGERCIAMAEIQAAEPGKKVLHASPRPTPRCRWSAPSSATSPSWPTSCATATNGLTALGRGKRGGLQRGPSGRTAAGCRPSSSAARSRCTSTSANCSSSASS